jgi:hypothetical protein
MNSRSGAMAVAEPGLDDFLHTYGSGMNEVTPIARGNSTTTAAL